MFILSGMIPVSVQEAGEMILMVMPEDEDMIKINLWQIKGRNNSGKKKIEKNLRLLLKAKVRRE